MKPHEDWVDGSWIVDCVCGVSFDDGKEMVNCDECGVWVHTWCSRYVKGDDLFACHKCKIKNNNDNIEMSTKTLRMEDSSTQSQTVGFRPCIEIPIEDRVHVQGVPGGDLALFERFSSVFSRQLWKCTGYVPKKFRFQYSEFPCWDEKENVCGFGDQEDTCAGVLFSMSKETDVVVPTSGLVSTMRLNDKKLCLKDPRDMEMKHYQSVVNKEKSLLCPLRTYKVRKELLGASEDRVKKKVKVADTEEEDDKNDFVAKF